MMSSKLSDLQIFCVRFNRDFYKLSEYFMNPKGYNIQNTSLSDENKDEFKFSKLTFKGGSGNFDNRNLLDDNNMVEIARGGHHEEHNNHNNDNEIKVSRSHKPNVSHVHEENNEEVFYGASDNEGDDDNNNTNLISIRRSYNTQSHNNNQNDINDNESYHTTPNNMKNKLDTNPAKFYDVLYDNRRKELPVKRLKLNLNVWKILKNAIGKDLSKFCVPGM